MVAHLVRTTGKQEVERKQSGLVAQYHRLVSTCVVRGQAQCILFRVSAISGRRKVQQLGEGVSQAGEKAAGG